MRRSILVLLSLVVWGLSLIAATPAQALSAPSGVKVSSGDAFDVLVVSWKWSSKPASYIIQIAQQKSFDGADQFKVAAKNSKPAGGRQSYRATGLQDGTKFYVRVAAATKSGKKSGWSSVVTGETRMRTPSAPDAPTTAEAGPNPGEVTFTWFTEGKYTDYFRIDASSLPFNQKGADPVYFKINPGIAKTGPGTYQYTMTAAQTEQAGVGIGTGWTLIWRFHAYNTGTAGGKKERYFGQGQSRVPGVAPTGTGSAIRVASYNVRTYKGVPGEDTWAQRSPRVVQTIKDQRPDIVLMQELFPSQMDTFLSDLHNEPSLNSYQLTRTAGVKKQTDGDRLLQARLLYDTTKYTDVSNCPDDPNDTECLIRWKADIGYDHAAVNLMEDKVSGQKFWICSFHLSNGDGLDQLRKDAMKTIVDELAARNNGKYYPIILGGDTNSSQLRTIRPHDVMMDAGYYDTASTVDQINAAYGTANDFTYQEPSEINPSPRIDVIATLNMPGSDTFKNVVVQKGDPFPSDHNMIWADLRLPEPSVP